MSGKNSAWQIPIRHNIGHDGAVRVCLSYDSGTKDNSVCGRQIDLGFIVRQCLTVFGKNSAWQIPIRYNIGHDGAVQVCLSHDSGTKDYSGCGRQTD